MISKTQEYDGFVSEFDSIGHNAIKSMATEKQNSCFRFSKLPEQSVLFIG